MSIMVEVPLKELSVIMNQIRPEKYDEYPQTIKALKQAITLKELPAHCGDKIRFKDHMKAMNFIGKHFKTLNNLPTLVPYKCNECDGVHIGHYHK